MGEGLVGLRHAVDIVLALVGAALLVLRVHELVRKPLGHRLLAALASELDEPADREGPGAAGGDLDRHLVGRAADAAGTDLEHRREGLDRRLEGLHPLAGRGPRPYGGRGVDGLLRPGLFSLPPYPVYSPLG